MADAQIIQESVKSLQVLVAPREGYSKSSQSLILSNLRERLGNNMDFEVKEVDSIPRIASGKFRYVISRVPLGLIGAKQTGDVIPGLRE